MRTQSTDAGDVRLEETADTWTITAFAASLGVSGAVSEALRDGASVPAAGEFEFIQSLAGRPVDEIEAKLRAGRLIELVAAVLSTGAAGLKTAQAATGAELNKKFAADAFKGEMGFGGTAEFYGGLEGIIGSPTFLEGSLLKSLEREHCGLKDANLPFESSNGIQGTTPAKEWEFVFNPDASSPDRYAERSGDFRTLHPEWCRNPTSLAVMEERMRLKNADLVSAGQTPLILEELIAGRLYTGPMYEKYNAVLRFFALKNEDGSVRIEYPSEADVPFLQKKCGALDLGAWRAAAEGSVRWEWANTYTTTIHAINSVVVKCSRLTKVGALYRGWTDATLPRSFFEADAMGVKGGVEYGFSSTTTERAQAAHYAQGKASTILQLQMGMVDRGADISWLSQYPHEKETLLPPLMGLQVHGTGVDGGTLIVECRISVNMASLTLEQVAGKRKKLLGDMAVQMTSEVRAGLTAGTGVSAETADEAGRMLQTKLEPMFAEDAEAFNKDVRFQKAVDEMLKAKSSVEYAAMLAAPRAGAQGGLEAAIERVEPGPLQGNVVEGSQGGLEAAMKRVEHLQGNVVDLSEMDLREGGADVAVVVAWMGSNPSGLSGLKIKVAQNLFVEEHLGLLKPGSASASLGGVNRASAEVVAALHRLVAQTTSLIDLDIMESGAQHLNVLKLNGTERVKSLDLTGTGLGPVSAAIVATCIQHNRVVEYCNVDGYPLKIDELQGRKPVEKIVLHSRGLGVASALIIASCIKENGVFKGLNLQSNNLCGIEWIPAEYKDKEEKGEKKQGTGVYKGTFTVEGITKLLEAFKGSAATELNLARNLLGAPQHVAAARLRGAFVIAAALKETKIKSLDLMDNHLTKKAKKVVTDAAGSDIVIYGGGSPWWGLPLAEVTGLTRLCVMLRPGLEKSLHHNSSAAQLAAVRAEHRAKQTQTKQQATASHAAFCAEVAAAKADAKAEVKVN